MVLILDFKLPWDENKQFANNFGKLVEDSSLDFLDVDSIKYVEGMRIF